MQGRNWVLVAVAAVIGIFAVVIANSWFSGVEQENEEATAALQQGEMVEIVVATEPLDFGTPLTVQNLDLAQWPSGSVPQGAFLTLDQAVQNNRVATRPIVPGEPVLADKVSGADGRATLAALLPPGMRAVSVPVDAIRGVAGFVLPGSSVDVILTRRITPPGATIANYSSDVILENVQVLAVDQTANDSEDEPRVSQTATLAVSLIDAQRLAVAEGLGTVSLALRKVEDNADPISETAAPRSATITGADLGAGRMLLPPSSFSPSVRVRNRTSPRGGSRSSERREAPSGSRMEVVRGTETTSYPVSTTKGE